MKVQASSSKTPRELGYRIPAEWERHEATWLAWPRNREDWPGKFQAIPWLCAEIVRLLTARERVHILVDDRQARQCMVERKGSCLEVASRRPSRRFGVFCGFEGGHRIPHQVAELKLENPVKALDDRDTRSQQGRFIADEVVVRGIAS